MRINSIYIYISIFSRLITLLGGEITNRDSLALCTVYAVSGVFISTTKKCTRAGRYHTYRLYVFRRVVVRRCVYIIQLLHSTERERGGGITWYYRAKCTSWESRHHIHEWDSSHWMFPSLPVNIEFLPSLLWFHSPPPPLYIYTYETQNISIGWLDGSYTRWNK